MKKLLILPIMILLSLSGCKKSEDVAVQGNQPPITQIGPEVGPGTFGVIPVPENEYDAYPKYIIDPREGRLSADPVNLDMPPPDWQGQGTESSCVGWATGYTTRSYLYHIDKNTVYLSTSGVRDNKTIFSPRFIYNSLIQKKGSPLDNGSRIDEALELLTNVGVCTWQDMPYLEKQFAYPVSTAQIQAAGNYKIKSWVRLPTENGALLVEYVKKFLKNRGVPIIISIIPDEGFQDPKENVGNGYEMLGNDVVWKSFVKKTPILGVKENVPRHAIVVVGYDDTRHAFKLMNSYGNGWGNEGFIWMDYDLFPTNVSFNGKSERVVSEAYIAISSLAGLVPVQNAPTGQIAISYACDEKQYRLPNGDPNLGTYHYEFSIKTENSYEDKLEKYIYLITPDKKAYYKISLGKSLNNDGKTFSTSIIYAPFDKRYSIYNGQILASPYYIPYDIQYILTIQEAELLIPNNYGGYSPPTNMDGYTPPGLYEFIVVIKNNDGKLTASKRASFSKPFFDVTSCNGKLTPLTSLDAATF